MLARGAGTLEVGPVNDPAALSGMLAPFLDVLASAATVVNAGDWLQLIGAAFVTYAFHGGGCRVRWFFWAMLVLAMCIVWQPVLGTVFGVWWFWCLAWTRHEFFSKQVILTSP